MSDAFIITLSIIGAILMPMELACLIIYNQEMFSMIYTNIRDRIHFHHKKGKLPTDFVKVKRAERTIIRPHTTFDPHTNKLFNKNNGYNYTITVYDQNDDPFTMNISEPTWNLLVEYTKSSPNDTLFFINTTFDAHSFTQMILKGIDIQLSNITKGPIT